MKQLFIHDGDIDLALLWSYIRQKLLLIGVCVIIGGVLGTLWGMSRPTRVQVSALIKPPEMWEYYDKELSHSVLYTLSQQQVQRHPEFGVTVIWYTMPLDTTGKVQNTVIAYLVDAENEVKGVEQLDAFKTSLQESTSVADYFEKAHNKVAADATGAQLAVSKQYELWKSLLANHTVTLDTAASQVFTEQVSNTVKLQQLLEMSSQPQSLEWLTVPVQSSGELSKPTRFYTVLAAIAAGLCGVLIAIFPGMGFSFYDRKAKAQQ